ncbi:hypothetical protein Tco_0061490, partial [Tanacetum coccineum]
LSTLPVGTRLSLLELTMIITLPAGTTYLPAGTTTLPVGTTYLLVETKSERTRQATNHLCLNVEVEEHSLGDLGEPANYKAAMLDPKSKRWIDAMNAKMQSMIDNMVWVLVDLPPNCKTIGSKWIFRKRLTWMAMYTSIKLVLWQRVILKPIWLIMKKRPHLLLTLQLLGFSYP